MADATLEMKEMEPAEAETEEHAEVSPDPSDPPTYGTNNRDLPKQLKEAIDSLIKIFSAREQYDRRLEYLMDRLLRFYDDGVQHFYPNWGTGVYQIGTAGGVVDLGNGRQIDCPEYMGAYNIFRRDRRTLHAVLTQNPPGVDFIPNQLGNPEGEQSAEIAEGYRHYFDQANDVKQMQENVSRYMCLSGRVVTRVYTAQDAQRWGMNEEGKPRQMETCKVYGTLETRVPIACRDFDKMVFCFIYEDPDALTAKSQNPWIRKKITGGEPSLGESEAERFARLGVKQTRAGQTRPGQTVAYLTTELHGFMRPAAFEDMSCDNILTDDPPEGHEWTPDEDGQVTIRSALLELFPEGIHAKYIGKTYSESWAEAMDDSICVGFPDVRDGMTGGALMEPAKITQDTFNDFKNAERENYEKGWPATYFKGSANDYNAIADTRSAPGRFHLLKEALPDQTIEGNIVYREPDFSVPESFVDAMEELRTQLEPDLVGALPALQGNAKASQTASGQAMDRSQAMGMLGPAWANMQRMFATIYTQVVLLASKNPDHAKEITVAGKSGAKVTFELQRIRKGSFHAKADVDSSFPESTAAKRANIQTFLPLAATTPLGDALFESPDNWEELIELNGNMDLTLIPAIAYKKQMRELEVLLAEPPQDNSQAVQQAMEQHAQAALQAEAQGMPDPPFQPPPPLKPSIMPEPDDFHKWESAKCGEYLSSEDCWIRMTTGTPEQIQQAQQGIQNVRLHKAVHDQMAAAQMAAMQPPPAAPAPKPKPPAGQAPEAKTQVQKNTAPPGSPGVATI